MPGRTKKREFSIWDLRSRLDRASTLEDHVRDVLDQLEANKGAFQEISREYGGVMELVGHFDSFYPGLYFEREVIEHLAEYSLSVDFDFYFPDWPTDEGSMSN